MGALTLKSFPFELRGWDIEKFESLDPTDGFGRNTKVYISKQQIVQIEPEYDCNINNNWLSDKGRQFFDGIFGACDKNQNKITTTKEHSWKKAFKILSQTFYLFDHLTNKQQIHFTIIFGNVDIETLSLLSIISHNYSFITIKYSETIKLNNDLESTFQLNSGLTEKKLNSSDLCLLIGNNPRYESYSLNLELKQRFFKGNFKCLNLGSLINLTFSSMFLGTNFNILKTIIEGNNFICQDLKTAKNPTLIMNDELFKRTDGQNLLKTFKILKYSNLFNKTFVNYNILNSSIYTTGIYSIINFETVNLKDLIQLSSLYLINVNLENIGNFKKLTETRLLNYYSIYQNIHLPNFIIDQNYYVKNNYDFYKNKLPNYENYSYLPSKMFYENDETLITTKGIIKHTSKIISKQNSKNNWKLLRNFLKNTKKHLTFLNKKENSMVILDLKKQNNFKNYITFNYHASEKLDNTGFMLINKNSSFYINTTFSVFKLSKIKLINTKLKYWLEDFFIGGKDGYSQNSLVLTNCSKILRNQFTTFFF
jgi:hypothetical protein